MAKINNVVRIVEFENESDLYGKLEDELVSYFGEPDSRCYRLKNFQLLESNRAVLYFEEDLNVIMVRFIGSNGELIYADDDTKEIDFYSLQELQLMDNLGVVTISDTEYSIENIEYVINEYGVRHANVFFN